MRVNNKRHSLPVISTVTNKGQMCWRIFEGAINAKILIDFLRRLIKGATKKVFLILDNLRVHHAKPVKVCSVSPRGSANTSSMIRFAMQLDSTSLRPDQ